MSLENFWPQSFDEMGRTRGNKDKKDVPSEPGDDNVTQDGDQTEFDTADGLDPALAKTLSIMTSNIIKVIDEKLSPLAETIHKHATELLAASKRLDEAGTRLLAVENIRRSETAERGMPYAMLLPATVQVIHGGSKNRFSTPEEGGLLLFSWHAIHPLPSVRSWLLQFLWNGPQPTLL
ncbi:uncharacterized protein LOC123986873 isoform X2 [Micropterus dolomieu]|uniref:uncharacterized protein LOC123986873 isoform X2 n=2 Tax=Micropterus dolomieu TaxID=147949 RepID=UPI001E8D1DE7|nr:uncharacterized protein LOC123986873 isoform X2 [Micropterus dolomieu]